MRAFAVGEKLAIKQYNYTSYVAIYVTALKVPGVCTNIKFKTGAMGN